LGDILAGDPWDLTIARCGLYLVVLSDAGIVRRQEVLCVSGGVFSVPAGTGREMRRQLTNEPARFEDCVVHTLLQQVLVNLSMCGTASYGLGGGEQDESLDALRDSQIDKRRDEWDAVEHRGEDKVNTINVRYVGELERVLERGRVEPVERYSLEWLWCLA